MTGKSLRVKYFCSISFYLKFSDPPLIKCVNLNNVITGRQIRKVRLSAIRGRVILVEKHRIRVCRLINHKT